MVSQTQGVGKIYPLRQKCRVCRKKFGTIVLESMFCSYKCAGRPKPTTKIGDTPRECKRQINGEWGFKTRYKSVSEVPQKFQDDPSTNIYLCQNCLTYHIGHSRVNETRTPEQLVRYVTSFEELGSVIGRFMETRNIDKKVVAKKLGCPIVRVTEVIDGSSKVSPIFLFKLLHALNLRIEITSPSVKHQ